MWWNRDACRRHADWRSSAWWQPDTWWPHADWHWCASWQPDTRWHHADWHWRAECPEVFDAAAGLLTDLLVEGLDAARLGRFLRSNCARDVVWSLSGEDAWDGFTDPFAAVQDGASQLDRAPSENVAAGEDDISELDPAPSQAVAAACATTAPPAETSPAGDESGGIGPVEQASMASAYRAVALPTALGSAHGGAGHAPQSYVRSCRGCQILFSSRRVLEVYCCSVCRQTCGKAHSSGTSTCKREVLEAVSRRPMGVAES